VAIDYYHISWGLVSSLDFSLKGFGVINRTFERLAFLQLLDAFDDERVVNCFRSVKVVRKVSLLDNLLSFSLFKLQ
jgi:hypothetical protein